MSSDIKTKQIVKQEVAREDNDLKTVYYYVDTENGVDIKTKEVFKKEVKTIFYQLRLNWKTKEVLNKYKTIERITLEGLTSLPQGFSTRASKNYAVTKTLNPLIRFIDDNSDFKEIIISKTKKTKINNSVIIINIKDVDYIRKNISALINTVNKKNKVFVQNFFAEKFPSYFDKTKYKYQKGTIFRLINENQKLEKEISTEDKKALFDLFERLSFSKQSIFEKKELISTKEKIERKFIEDVLNEFKRLLSLKKITENKWQDFFKENAWIFSQIFAHPTVFFEDQAFVGGKAINNKNGKYVDFLYNNKLTKNSALIEIKKHTTKLLKDNPYRGSDVFQPENELSGAISQIIDQKEVYSKKFDAIRGEDDIFSFNPKCIIIVGKIDSLKKKQIKSFELLRSNLKDVEIITFDELFERINSILQIFGGTEK